MRTFLKKIRQKTTAEDIQFYAGPFIVGLGFGLESLLVGLAGLFIMGMWYGGLKQ